MHTNKINGKKYIGITGQKPEKRWGKDGHEYRVESQPLFSRAIIKYGWNNFFHEIIQTNLSKECACEKEIMLINNFKTQNPKYGYNIQPGGSLGNAGRVFSEESKSKMSIAHKGKKLSEEHKKHISEALYNHTPCVHTEESKRKLREANLGKKLSQETKDKISKTLTGIKRTKETIERIKENSKSQKVYCPELDMIFRSINEAAEYTGTYRANIQQVLKGERKCAGRHPETRDGLHWKTVE